MGKRHADSLSERVRQRHSETPAWTASGLLVISLSSSLLTAIPALGRRVAISTVSCAAQQFSAPGETLGFREQRSGDQNSNSHGYSIPDITT